MEYERFLGPSSPKFGCEEANLFEDDSITNSQFLYYVEAPTQEEKPEGPLQSPEVEVIPPSENMEGIESQQSAPLRDGQDIIGHGDLDNSSPSGEEPPLGQGGSKEMESCLHQLEPSEQGEIHTPGHLRCHFRPQLQSSGVEQSPPGDCQGVHAPKLVSTSAWFCVFRV